MLSDSRWNRCRNGRSGKWLCKGYTLLLTWPATTMSCPKDVLPLLLNESTQAERLRFDFTVEQRGGKLLLKAVPKQKRDAALYGEIDVTLDPDSYLLSAHRVVGPSGNTTVYLFTDVKINQPPADRNTLMKAALPGYRLLRADEMVLGRNKLEQTS